MTNPANTGPTATTVIYVVMGAFIVVVGAQVAPTVVNGFLLLLLFGIILFNSDRWMPYLPGVPSAPLSQAPPGAQKAYGT